MIHMVVKRDEKLNSFIDFDLMDWIQFGYEAETDKLCKAASLKRFGASDNMNIQDYPKISAFQQRIKTPMALNDVNQAYTYLLKVKNYEKGLYYLEFKLVYSDGQGQKFKLNTVICGDEIIQTQDILLNDTSLLQLNFTTTQTSYPYSEHQVEGL